MPSAKPPRQVQIVHRERLVDDFFRLDAVDYRFERFDGTLSDPVRRLVLERGDSVAALLLDGDRVLLAEQFRIATQAHGPGWLTELVAGMVREGETPEVALRREALEEAGCELGDLKPLGCVYLSPGGSSERVHLFVAPVRRRCGAGGGVAAEGEDIRLVALTRGELQALLRSGGIVDAKTLIAVMAYLGGRP
jgi:ADP-ribose pyrophosphatase